MNQPSPEQPVTPAPLSRKMNVVTVFDPARMVRTHQVTGNASLPAFCGILEGLYASKQFNPDMNSLWDLRLADFSGITPEDVRALMHVVVSNWQRSGKCHSAILVASMTEFGMARTYESQFGRNAPCKIKIFLDLNEARQWLGLGDSAVEAVPASNQQNAKAGA